MDIFDRIRDAVGEGDGDTTADVDPGVDRGAGSPREEGSEDGKAGSHGSHWDTLLPDNGSVRELLLAAVERGATREGASTPEGPVSAHVYPTSGPVRTVALSVDGRVVTAFPVGDGVERHVTLSGITEWANGVEAQLSFEHAGTTLGAFDTGYFARGRDWYDVGTSYGMDVAGFAYDIGPVDEGEGGVGTDEPAGVTTLARFDGGDLDDYVFRTRIRGVEDHTVDEHGVYRLRVPTILGGDDDREGVVYAGPHAVDGGRPAPGDEVSGVLWLQGRIV